MKGPARFWSKVAVAGERECWLWTAYRDRDGYGRFRGLDGRPIGAHRFSYALANGPIPDGLCVCHRCDTPACVNPSHLWLGTDADNHRDRGEKKRAARRPGSMSATAKLSDAQVSAIRWFLANGEPQASIAQRFGVSPSTVSLVKSGKRWSHHA